MTTHAAQPEPRRRVEDSVLATAPGVVLLVVAVVSVALHGLAAYGIWNRPFGRIDPASLEVSRPPIRVKRATFDQITGVRSGASAEARAAQQMSLADITAALLHTQEPPGLEEEDFEPELQLRNLEDTLPAQPAAELAVELPAFELPPQVLDELAAAAIPDELAYRSTADVGFAPGDGSGDGASGGGGGSAAARELLQSTGLVAGGAGRPSPLDRTLPDDAAPMDETLLQVPLAGPDIDFAGLALQGTTQIEVPEHLDADFDYVVTTFRDPRAAREGDGGGYFRVDVTARRSLHKLRAMPKDVIFLVDTSSSLPQDWINEVSLGVGQAIRVLNEGDRFNVVLFKENPAFFSTQGPRPATFENIEAAQQFITTARSQGYTDVNAALSQLLVRDVAQERVYELILISDGMPTKGVVDTRELINLITRDNNLAASIYCVGVGNRQNRELLDFLAYRNKGYTLFATRREQVAPTLRDLASRLRYPLIKNLRVSVAGRGVEEVYPVHLPNIHQSERFSLFGRYDQPVAFTMQIAGQSAGGRGVDFTFARNLAEAPRGEAQIATDWAFWKLHHLYSELIRRGQDPAVLDQIEYLRKRYKLKTLY